MRKSRLARIQLKWRNPYTEPPDNQPRIVFDEVVDDNAYRAGTIEEVAELEKRPDYYYKGEHPQLVPLHQERKEKTDADSD